MRVGLCECFVVGENVNHCYIEKIDDYEYVDLYYSHNLDQFEENRIGRYTTDSFTFNRVNSDKRIYYWLVFPDKTRIQFGERILKIPGMYNFRDIGGYPTMDNRRVRWGKIFRGDQLFNLKDEGLDYVESLGLKTIVDFRSPQEISQYPNKLSSTIENSYNFSPEAEIAMFAGRLQNNELHDSPELMKSIAEDALKMNPNAGEQNMIEQQKKFASDPTAIDSFKKATNIFMNSQNSPIYQHCKGGKDRTGFSVMIQLAILGVEEKYLFYDYMLTRKAREEKNKLYYKNFLSLTQDEDQAKYFYALFDTKESYLQGAISKILENYPSILEYAKQVYGITDQEIKDIRNSYLE